jgi:hypothetical protein
MCINGSKKTRKWYAMLLWARETNYSAVVPCICEGCKTPSANPAVPNPADSVFPYTQAHEKGKFIESLFYKEAVTVLAHFLVNALLFWRLLST